MSLVFADRVAETSTTTGTGTLTLAGAKTGYQSFAVVGNGNTCNYCIALQGGSEWEVGIGTYASSGTTLARTTVQASSNSNSAVSFSAGTKDVFLVQNATRDSTLVVGPASVTDGHLMVFDGTTGKLAKDGGAVLLSPVIESHTASSVASLDFTTRNASGRSGATFQSDADEYEVSLVGLIAGTTGVTFSVRFSTDGGSTFDSGSNYSGAAFRASNLGSAPANIGGTALNISGNGTHVNTATKPFIATFRIYDPLNTSTHKRIIGHSSAYDGTGNPDVVTVLTGTYASTSAVNAMRILVSGGTFSGPIVIRAVPK